MKKKELKRRLRELKHQMPEISILVSPTGLCHIKTTEWDYFVRPGSAVILIGRDGGYPDMPTHTDVSLVYPSQGANDEVSLDGDLFGLRGS